VIFEKTLMTLAAAAAIAAAAAVAVVAAAFALYALAIPYVGAAGAAAIVAAVAAVIVGIAALMAARKVEGRGHAHGHGQDTPHDAIGIAQRVFELAKERPILSIGAALAAGVFALRNPVHLATVAKAFLDTKRPPQR